MKIFSLSAEADLQPALRNRFWRPLPTGVPREAREWSWEEVCALITGMWWCVPPAQHMALARCWFKVFVHSGCPPLWGQAGMRALLVAGCHMRALLVAGCDTRALLVAGCQAHASICALHPCRFGLTWSEYDKDDDIGSALVNRSDGEKSVRRTSACGAAAGRRWGAFLLVLHAL